MAIRHAALTAALALTLACLATPAPVPAQPVSAQPGTTDDIQDLIKEHLLNFPGGVQTGLFEITYYDPVFVMTFLPIDLVVNGSPDCPSGWFCFYDHTNYGYPRGKLSACGWQDLARWGWHNRTESAHYNLGSGSVAFLNHADGFGSHDFDYAVFGVGTSQRTIPDTSPYLNTADHVQRYC